jgi:hypothetical protein
LILKEILKQTVQKLGILKDLGSRNLIFQEMASLVIALVYMVAGP